jgi:putative membrane protein
LAARRGCNRIADTFHCLPRFPLVLSQRRIESLDQFRQFPRSGRRIFQLRRIFRRRRIIGRWRRIGELVMSVSTEDRERISTAIRAAEARTSGEIVCVLAQTSSDTTALPILVAAILALALPWLLVGFTSLPVNRILLLQVIAFFGLAAMLCLPRIRVALMPRAMRRAVAHRVALEQFMIRGIAHKKERTGILIFVSLAERYARIVADDGIAAQVPQSEWQKAVDALTAHIVSGRIADGFIAAIDVCGNVLAKNFPRSGTSRDELPDRIYLI